MIYAMANEDLPEMYGPLFVVCEFPTPNGTPRRVVTKCKHCWAQDVRVLATLNSMRAQGRRVKCAICGAREKCGGAA